MACGLSGHGTSTKLYEVVVRVLLPIAGK